jgi:hypothetical protein
LNDPVIVPPRRSLTRRQRIKLFDAHKGICYLCETKIVPGEAWIDEHIDPRSISANDSMENRAPVHAACAKKKTKTDVATIASVLRIRAKHLGIKKSGRRMPGGRDSEWKKTFNHGWVKR